MKQNLILRSAVAGVLSAGVLVGPEALALKPGDVPAGNVLRFSGATATDSTVQDAARLIVGGFCADNDANAATASTLASYYFSRSSEGGQVAILCQGAAGQAFSGVNFGLLKESEFGSASGSAFVAGVATTSIDFLDIYNAGFLCRGDDDNAAVNDAGTYNPGLAFDTPKTLAGDANRQAVRQYTNCTPQAVFPAEAGISDVEAQLLGGDGGQALPTPQFQILFGVPVSLNLYRALQEAQGLTGTDACDTLAELDTEACVPTLHKATIASLSSGGITNWQELKRPNGTALTTVSNAGLGIAAPVSNSVYVCRRGNSSGTQIGTRAYFLAQGCAGSDTYRLATNGTCNGEANGNPYGNAVPVDCNRDGDFSDTSEFASADFSNTLVFASDGSGDVRNCLDDRDDQNRWAIGVLSTENSVDGTVTVGSNVYTVGNLGGTGGTARDTLSTTGGEVHSREFRFIRVSDYLPSVEAAANGGYDFYTENVCYERNGALTGVEKQVYDALCVNGGGLSNTGIIQRLNAGFDNQPWGDGGIMGIPLLGGKVPNTVPGTGYITQALMATNPVNSFRKSATGVVNNCSESLGVTTATQGTTATDARGPNP